MPGVDLLDAFAELIVCVVFNLPRDEPQPSTTRSSSSSNSGNDSDNDEGPVGGNSSGTTQIFSRVNLADENQSQEHPLPRSPFPCAAPPPSGANSTHSLDLYPGGIWNPAARLSTSQAAAAASTNLSAAIAAAATTGNNNNATYPLSQSLSHPSSVASLNTGDISTPRSSGPSTDRSAGFWNRLLGGSGVLHTPPRTSSYGQFPNTGGMTNASSYVQLTEEELGMINGSGHIHGNGGSTGLSGWTGFSTPPSLTQHNSTQQFEWAGGGGGKGADSRGIPTPSNLSTPLDEASPYALSAQLSTTHATSTSSHQQQQPSQLNPHGLRTAARRSSSPQEGQSHASSSSEFVVL